MTRATIIWHPEAEETFFSILAFVQGTPGEQIGIRFEHPVNEAIQTISRNTMIAPIRFEPDIRRYLVHPNGTLFYRVEPFADVVHLISFWDNRQNPDKLRF